VAALDPAVAAVRTAVRAYLRRTPEDGVMVACSGGADSFALAAAAAFVGPRLGRRIGLTTVDHQLQPGSAERAEAVARWAVKAGLDPVEVRTVRVPGRPGGPEAAAREARYEALVAAAREAGAGRVLLGHTRDDQAETVLLALLRGSGARGLAGMPLERELDGVILARPLLELPRARTRAACVALQLQPWEDPHNHDPAFRRTHARAALASLVDALGPAVVANLARTASLAGADAELLDVLATEAGSRVVEGDGLSVTGLAGLAPALRSRVLHAWARSLGAPAAALAHVHVEALAALVTDWRGQGPVGLPGGIRVARSGSTLRSI
jgi:tRNA(Ile)-lysidine synthase